MRSFHSLSVSERSIVLGWCLYLAFVLTDLAQKPGDVREEIRLYGSENTAAAFNAMRAQRRQMIMNQREGGISGVITNLSKAQGYQTDEQR